jgi:hypothetical protein
LPVSRCFKSLPFFFFLVLILGSYSTAQTIPSSYFGMHMSSGITYSTPWPQVGVGGFRMLSTETNWNQLNPSPGVYNWSMLDRWLSVAQRHGLSGDDLIFTFAGVPKWASSKPGDNTCAGGSGTCDPPNDLNADGSGTNQHWKNFVHALASHVAGRVRYWEVWNEPYWKPYFTGTPAQIVRMAQDLRSIVQSVDPNARILSTAGSDMRVKLKNACWAAANMDPYFSAGIGKYVDVINFHAYFAPTDAPNQPENYASEVQCIRTMMANHGQQNKPLWASEGGWGHNTDLTNLDSQAAFVGRAYLLLWSEGVKRFYWYRWDNAQLGTLWNSTNGLLKPGQAYSSVHDWLVGATMTTPCSTSQNIWTCYYTLANGATAEAVWSLSTKNYTPARHFTKYRTLSGTTAQIPGNRVVAIGQKPILLE